MGSPFFVIATFAYCKLASGLLHGVLLQFQFFSEGMVGGGTRVSGSVVCGLLPKIVTNGAECNGCIV